MGEGSKQNNTMAVERALSLKSITIDTTYTLSISNPFLDINVLRNSKQSTPLIANFKEHKKDLRNYLKKIKVLQIRKNG